MNRFGVVAGLSVALSACALKGDVRRVEEQVMELRTEMARADSARADFLSLTLQQIILLQRQVLDSLQAQARRLAMFRGSISGDMTEVQRLLMLIEEISGQSQQRLSELQGRGQERETQVVVVDPPTTEADTAAAAPTPQAGSPTVEEVYDASIRQLDRGSPTTARLGFRMIIQQFPDHRLAQDAQFHVAESWQGSFPDSAAAAYELVVDNYPNSPRAPTALYRLGLIAEQNGDNDAARVYYTRVVAMYPSSDAAELARTKLNPSL